MRKNIIYFAIVAVLLLVTIAVAISGFRTPRQVPQVETLLTYNLQGNFSHQAYGYATTDYDICVACGQLSDLVYFPTIIKDFNCSYKYDFLSEDEISSIKSKIQISAVLNRAGYWSKSIVLVPLQEMSGDSVTFKLDTESYLNLANSISQELGLGQTSSVNVFLTASIQTEATINNQIITDNFVHTNEIAVGLTTIEWARPLDYSIKGFQSDIVYTQNGLFGYTIDLLPNQLFGEVTLTSPTPEIKILRKLDQQTSYRSDSIDSLNVNFTYNLMSDTTVTGITNDVRASLVLSSIEGTQVVFPVDIQQQYTNDFTLRIPVDVTLLYDIIRKIENTAENDFINTYNLTLRIDIHTTTTEPGIIDETISAILPIELTADYLTVESVADNTKSGTLTKTVMISNSTRSTLLMTSLSLLCLTIIAGLWAGWSFWEKRRRFSPIYQLWEAARQTMDKHKDIFVSVMEIPTAAENEKTTQLESLAELVKLSDSLLKPVLHQQDIDRHIFCVVDGTSRFVYMIIEPPPL